LVVAVLVDVDVFGLVVVGFGAALLVVFVGTLVGADVAVAFGLWVAGFVVAARVAVALGRPVGARAGGVAASLSGLDATNFSSSCCFVSPAASAVVAPIATRVTAATADVTVLTSRSPRSRSLGLTDATSTNIRPPP
jgi:hypothetical protein